LSHLWTSVSNIVIKIISQDEQGLNSSWSDDYNIIISQSTPEDDLVSSGEKEQYFSVTDQTVFFNSSLFSDVDDLNENEYLYNWNFGDGETGFGKTPDHVYKIPGTYVITLTINDINGTIVETKTFELTVYPESNMLPLGESNLDDQNKDSNFIVLPYFMIIGVIALLSIGLLIVKFVYLKN